MKKRIKKKLLKRAWHSPLNLKKVRMGQRMLEGLEGYALRRTWLHTNRKIGRARTVLAKLLAYTEKWTRQVPS